MAVLDYASPKTARKPYRHAPLIVALACLVLTLTFVLLKVFAPIGFFGTREIFSTFVGFSVVLCAIGEAATIAALITIRRRFRSPSHLFWVLLGSLACLLGLPLMFLLTGLSTTGSSHAHPPYLRLMAAIRTLDMNCGIYAASHNGKYPPHLAVLILQGTLAPRDVAGLGLPAYIPPSPLPPVSYWPLIATEVDAHSAFIYTAADLYDPFPAILDSHIILAYSKPDHAITPGHRVLLSADGARYVPDADLPAVFAASNAARAKLHLPPFTLDGPPPLPPSTAPAPTSP
jgi:hypothetical protein